MKILQKAELVEHMRTTYNIDATADLKLFDKKKTALVVREGTYFNNYLGENAEVGDYVVFDTLTTQKDPFIDVTAKQICRVIEVDGDKQVVLFINN